ncbi:MAG TPA: NADH-quinone oxidoreductase subunit C [Thermoanaerobaculia bacterium]|nr:NADH-quinone oxidoreductase subunit C [Thermoanaerobaculia bacterium]
MAEESDQQTTAPAAAEAPAPQGIEEICRNPLVAGVASRHREAILDAKEAAGEITLVIERRQIRDVCRAFKDDGFTYLVDLCGVDYSRYDGHPGDRFAVAYHLYSFQKNDRVRLKVYTPDGSAVPSVTPVWKTANWHEREVFDMFGIEFEDHPNLERILMWDDFNGHPLRKDFPIRGIDTGARIYPEVFPEGAGPQPGSTGKDYKDVNLYRGEWTRYGYAPVAQGPAPADEEIRAELAEGAPPATPEPTAEAPWHDPDTPIDKRMEMAQSGSLKDKLFAAMAQTDCTACGWDCEGYAEAIATGESSDLTLCVPGEAETEDMLKKLMAEASQS